MIGCHVPSLMAPCTNGICDIIQFLPLELLHGEQMCDHVHS